MNYNTVYVGMDVHKESFSLCAYTIETEKASHYQKTEADCKNVLKYLEFLITIYGDDTNFICGYEAGCLGYTLYHQLTANNVKCIILAPTTMLEQRSKKRIKTDKRDAEIIAKCLAQHNYSPVHIPTAKDEETKEFLRMRDDHKLALKKVKQQILAFCLRHNYRYDGNSHWTAAHLKWLKALTPEALYKEILDEYLLTYQTLSDKPNLCDTQTVVKYISRYLGPPVIALNRIDSYDGENVTFHYNRHEDNVFVQKTIPALDFISLLIQHIPEPHYKMTRYYGLYARHRNNDKQLRKAIHPSKHKFILSYSKWRNNIAASFGYDPLCCSKCKATMTLTDLL